MNAKIKAMDVSLRPTHEKIKATWDAMSDAMKKRNKDMNVAVKKLIGLKKTYLANVEKNSNKKEIIETLKIAAADAAMVELFDIAVKATNGKIMITAVIIPGASPYLLLKYSGTVLTKALLNFPEKKARIINVIAIAITYHEALIPQLPYAFSTTPRELPPPISVAAKVPAIMIGPSLLPATMKSSLL